MSEAVAELTQQHYGRRPEDCTDEEIQALIHMMDEQGKAHRAHAAELLHFARERGEDTVEDAPARMGL
jgi:hypothetical protein